MCLNLRVMSPRANNLFSNRALSAAEKERRKIMESPLINKSLDFCIYLDRIKLLRYNRK